MKSRLETKTKSSQLFYSNRYRLPTTLLYNTRGKRSAVETKKVSGNTDRRNLTLDEKRVRFREIYEGETRTSALPQRKQITTALPLRRKHISEITIEKKLVVLSSKETGQVIQSKTSND